MTLTPKPDKNTVKKKKEKYEPISLTSTEAKSLSKYYQMEFSYIKKNNTSDQVGFIPRIQTGLLFNSQFIRLVYSVIYLGNSLLGSSEN